MDLLSILVFNKLKNKKGGITPTGSVTITSNGTYDVTNFAEVKVDYDFEPDKELTDVHPASTTCFINTLVGQNLTNYTIEVKFTVPSSSTSTKGFIYGNSTGTDYGYGALYYGGNNGLAIFYGSNSSTEIYPDMTREVEHIVKSHFTSTKIENWVDGTKLTDDVTRTATTTGNPLCLFQRGINKDFGGMPYIHYLKLFNSNNKLVSHLVPAKDIAGTICVYDKVRNCYLYNTGTGTLNGGSVVS